MYFQDEQPSLTSTEKVPQQHDFISKEMVNSEPLSTINEKGNVLEFTFASTPT